MLNKYLLTVFDEPNVTTLAEWTCRMVSPQGYAMYIFFITLKCVTSQAHHGERQCAVALTPTCMKSSPELPKQVRWHLAGCWHVPATRCDASSGRDHAVFSWETNVTKLQTIVWAHALITCLTGKFLARSGDTTSPLPDETYAGSLVKLLFSLLK